MQDNLEVKGTIPGTDGLNPESQATPDLFKIMSDSYDLASGKVPAAVEVKPEAVAPEAKPVEEPAEKPAEDTKGKETPPTNTNPYAWVEGVTDDDLKAKIAQVLHERREIEHKYNSDRPRLNQARTAVQKLQAELEQLRAAKEAQPQGNTKPAATAPVDIPVDPEWNAIVEDDPKLARALEKRAEQLLDARLKQLVPELSTVAEERARTVVAPFQQERVAQHQQQELYRLQHAVPNYEQVVSSPQYNEWLEYYATPDIVALHNNADTFTKAITVLQAYDYYARQRFAPEVKAANVTDTSVADKLAKERETKTTTSVTPGANRQATPVGSGAKGPPTVDQLKKIMEQAYYKS
jgi:hypothetical protein